MEELIKRAKEGDREAMISIINKYEKFVFKEAYHYRIAGYDFEDLVQHGYLSIIKAVKMYKLGSGSNNGYFLSAISLNFKDLLKGTIRHYREIPKENIFTGNTGNIDYNFTLEDEVIAYDEVSKLYKALDKLEPLEKEIIEKHYLDGIMFKEIAADKDMKCSSVKYIREKAFKKLREVLEGKENKQDS